MRLFGKVGLRRVSSALAVTTSVAASGLSPAALQEGVECGWRITAVHVLAELEGDRSERAEKIRNALLDVGADDDGFVPESCNDRDSGTGSGTGGEAGSGSGGNDTGSGSGGAGDSASTGQGQTAAEALGWGEPAKVDDFEAGLDGWSLYDGPGHAGNGTRSPEAASVENGLLTINGSGDGTTAGMAWGDGQQYGRWEGRMKAPEGSPAYNALFLLWPSAENFPEGGEIDFAEITDQTRQSVELFLHYGADNSQVQGEVQVDATQWHNYAVEWTPEGVTAFLDGEEWWSTDDTSILPPGPMHLCIQLDWFPENGADGGSGQMQVDWVKQWPLGEGGSGGGEG